jgi:putative transcriptional regulator
LHEHAAWCFVRVACAERRDMMERMSEPSEPTSLRGMLLVATPPLVDPTFDRTVVLLLEHNDDGALGLVLNRPTEESVEDLLPRWSERVTGEAVVFRGGPVELDAVIGLARVKDPAEPDAEGIGTIDLSVDPDDLMSGVSSLRLFRGYSGWGPAQLEGELAERAWVVVDALPGDPFTRTPAHLWREVLRRQGGALARIGEQYPDDVSLN